MPLMFLGIPRELAKDLLEQEIVYECERPTAPHVHVDLWLASSDPQRGGALVSTAAAGEDLTKIARHLISAVSSTSDNTPQRVRVGAPERYAELDPYSPYASSALRDYLHAALEERRAPSRLEWNME
jgi:hypothetical protein